MNEFMGVALALAHQAAGRGEVPVGAVVVKDGQIIGQGSNQCIGDHDPSAHAEVVALRNAARHLGNYRLEGCDLYVTLEPCAMCAGAILNARVQRVVFGAYDERAGAAGSVTNLFEVPHLNHHTTVAGGENAQECAAVLTNFFKGKRHMQQTKALAAFPLRDDALRTPDDAFENLPGYPWQPQYINDLPSLNGLRQHYLDEGPKSAPNTYLCLHGNPAWSYLYRKMIPVWLNAGHRVVAPDLVGFGKSDKPKKDSFHTFDQHRNNLLELVEHLDLTNVILVVQDWGGILGLTLPMEAPKRYAGLLVMNTLLATGDHPLSAGFLAWREMCAKNPGFDIGRLFARGNVGLSAEECNAYNAPFPNTGYRAATRQFPKMVPDHPDAPGADLSRKAAHFWKHQWQGRTLMAVGMQDPVLGWPVMSQLRNQLAQCGDPLELPQAGHFVQEQGEPVAIAAVRYFAP